MVPLFVLALCGLAAAQLPVWPLDMPSRYLTGNFMEPRDGRFHAGLDLKTASRTGFPALAAADGHVSRIRMSATGLGQALYLTTDDGTTYAYGHLERLRDDLRALVAQRQRRQGRYEVDLWFAAHELPVARGEVLALSGQSATGGPHLHFEVRGPDGQPLDPLAHGFAVQDRLPPEILAVRAARAPDAEAGTWRIGDGKQPLSGTLPELRLAPGPLFFSTLIIERSDRQRHVLAPWRISLLVDDREVFVAVNDSLRWDLNHHQRLEYRQTALGRERWLRVDERNRLAGRRAEAWLSAGDWPGGRHAVRLVAEDRAGNRAEVSWTLVIDGEVEPAAAAGGGGWLPDRDVNRDRWLVGEPASPALAGAVPASSLAWRVAPLREPLPPRFWRLSGLQAVGQPIQYRLEGDWALLGPVRVTPPPDVLPADLDVDDPTLGVYRLRGRVWSYAGRVTEGNDGRGFELAQAGAYQVMRDPAPPLIATAGVTTELVRRPVVARGGVSPPAWPVLRIPVGDHGSGVDWSSLAVSLDGVALIVEPDPPRDRVLVELPDELAAGTYRLELAVRDRAGHRARAALTLALREEAAAGREAPDEQSTAAPSP